MSKLISSWCHIYASVNWVSIGSDNGLSPVWCQAITWTNAVLLSIRLLGTNFSEILIKIQNFTFRKMHLKVSSAKWRPSCPEELIPVILCAVYHLTSDFSAQKSSHLGRSPSGTTADSRLAPSQWETPLQSNGISHWLGANLESSLGTLYSPQTVVVREVPFH